MKIFRPRKIPGGHLGRTYTSVINAARKFANSDSGRVLKTGAKKAVLQAGSDVLNDFLSGKSGAERIKGGLRSLKRQLTKGARKRLKKSVLGRRKKLGGLLLYQLRKRRRRAKQKKDQLLYKISKRGRKPRRRTVTSKRVRKRRTKIRKSKRSPIFLQIALLNPLINFSHFKSVLRFCMG